MPSLARCSAAQSNVPTLLDPRHSPSVLLSVGPSSTHPPFIDAGTSCYIESLRQDTRSAQKDWHRPETFRQQMSKLSSMPPAVSVTSYSCSCCGRPAPAAPSRRVRQMAPSTRNFCLAQRQAGWSRPQMMYRPWEMISVARTDVNPVVRWPSISRNSLSASIKCDELRLRLRDPFFWQAMMSQSGRRMRGQARALIEQVRE